MKLSAFAEKYLTLHNDNKRSSLDQKRGMLYRTIIPTFGNMEMNEISQLDIDEWLAKLRDVTGLSNKTINNNATVLRNLLRTAKRYPELTGVFRLPEVRRQRPAEHIRDFLTPLQANLLLSSMEKEPVWHAMVLTALNTGLRIGELRALPWARLRLDTDAPQLTVSQSFSGYRPELGTPKGHKSRVVPLNRKVVQALETLDSSTQFVFAKPKHRGDLASPLSYKACYCRMRRAGVALKTPWLSWHTLRHSFASHLAMSGKVTILEIKDLLGHVDISVTMKYAKLMPSTLIRAVTALDDPTE